MSKSKKESTAKTVIKLIAQDRDLIIYRPNLRKITGSVLSTIVLQQILYWWNKNGEKPFYKFLAPCSHSAYRKGDSWTEELGLSEAEFRTAIRNIGFKKGKIKKGIQNEEDALIIYYKDHQGFTWYDVNIEKLEQDMLSYLVTEECSVTKESKDSSVTKKLNNPQLPTTSETTSYITDQRIELNNSINVFPKKRRKRKSQKTSMKDKVNERVKNKNIKPSASDKNTPKKVKYETVCNLHLIEVWNKQPNLSKLQFRNPPTNVYKKSLEYIHRLLNGTMHEIISSQAMKEHPELKEFKTPWTKKEIANVIRTLNEMTKEGNEPKKKDFLKKMNLASAIYNPYSGHSAFAYAKRYGIKPMYDAKKELTKEKDIEAFNVFADFFAKELNKDDTKTHKQIVALVKSFSGRREQHGAKWRKYLSMIVGGDPERGEINVAQFAREYVQFLLGERSIIFKHNEFVFKQSLTPNGLKENGYVFSLFEKQFIKEHDAHPITGSTF